MFVLQVVAALLLALGSALILLAVRAADAPPAVLHRMPRQRAAPRRLSRAA